LGPTSTGRSVFEHPENYVGQHVRLCGYIHEQFEDTNIWISRQSSEDPHGLGLEFISATYSANSPSRWHNRTACVTGTIFKTNCFEELDGKEIICTRTLFGYGIELDRHS